MAPRKRQRGTKAQSGGVRLGKAGKRGWRSPPFLLCACLFASGVASLMFEVVWTRQLRLVFGSTSLAISTTLAAYMIGLGIGGVVAGGLAARLSNPGRAYALMEAATGVYALCVPWLILGVTSIDTAGDVESRFWLAALLRFVAALFVLLVPTMLMGASLPLLVEAVVRDEDDVGAPTGVLYGINTLGAVSGVLVATFVLFRTVGLVRTSWVASAIDITVGLIALLCFADAPARHNPATAEQGSGATHRWDRTLALAAYSLVGFTALLFEVTWTRLFSMITGSSVYSFATMLAVFLAGIAGGSLLISRVLAHRDDALRTCAQAAVLLACSAAFSFAVISWIPDLYARLAVASRLSTMGVLGSGLLCVLLVMLLPTLILGALFPLFARAVATLRGGAGEAVGTLAFANSVGSAVGAFATGFGLIPFFGIERTIGIGLATAFLVGAGTHWLAARRRGESASWQPVACVVAAGLWIIAPPRLDQGALSRGVFRDPVEFLNVSVAPLPLRGVPPPQILFYQDGLNTTVSVHASRGQRSLKVNGKTDAGTGADMSTQVLLGELPMLFGHHADTALVIGLASGVTVGSVALHGPRQVDVVELEPAMAEASHYFDEYNHRPLENPSVNLVTDDGRTFLGRQRARYDVVISEPSNPWMTGAASLFTEEFFAAARSALKPDGRLLQWVHLYAMPRESLASILAALRSQFPFVYGFTADHGSLDLLLLASQQPMERADLPVWENISPAARADLARVGIGSRAELLSLLRLMPADIATLAAAARTVNTDDSMSVELDSPLALHDRRSGQSNWSEIERFSDAATTLTNDESGQAQVELALAYLERGEPALATRAAAGLTATPAGDAVAALSRLREGEDDTGLRDSAIDALGRAAETHPQATVLYAKRAALLYEAERFDEAALAINRAMAIRSDDPRSRYLRLQIRLAQGQLGGAWEDAASLLDSAFGAYEPGLWLNLSRVAQARGEFNEATEALRTYLRFAPEYPAHWENLSVLLRKVGRDAEATDAAYNAGQASRNIVLRLRQLGRRAESAGRRDEAVAELQRATQFDPQDAAAGADLRRLLMTP